MNSRRAPIALCCVSVFLLLATLNSAGYRYGASDQAFYMPAMLERMDPSLFPRDSELIRAQAQLTFADDVIGPVVRVTGVSFPVLFVVLQIVTLTLLALAVVRIGQVMYRSDWASLALLAAITLRHAILRSGTNTLEGYFHPRQLSFALGALAIGQFLRGRRSDPGLPLPLGSYGVMLVLLLIAGALHPTTGLWFVISLGIATFLAEPRLRVALGTAAAGGAALAVWALVAGPLAGRLQPMDQEWLATLRSKAYLFPLQWPATAWVVNLGYVPLIVWLYRRRRAAGVLVDREAALVAGVLALVVVFAATLPFNAARVALAIQLQPARVFWIVDFLAVIYGVWALADGVVPRPSRARFAAVALTVLSVARGAYIMLVEFPERRIVQVDLSDNDWGRVMRWARISSDPQSGWLAAPDHAVTYGTSVRVAGHRDVFVEPIKDEAVGMYARAIALRTRDRVAALGDFHSLTAERAQGLAAQYGLDYLVTDAELPLPVAFQSGALRIYRLR
jgi:hypothetical protein